MCLIRLPYEINKSRGVDNEKKEKIEIKTLNVILRLKYGKYKNAAK